MCDPVIRFLHLDVSSNFCSTKSRLKNTERLYLFLSFSKLKRNVVIVTGKWMCKFLWKNSILIFYHLEVDLSYLTILPGIANHDGFTHNSQPSNGSAMFWHYSRKFLFGAILYWQYIWFLLSIQFYEN